MNQSTLRQLCERHGVRWDVPSDPPSSLDQKPLSDVLFGVNAPSRKRVIDLAETAVDEERGHPGTQIIGKRVEPAVAKYDPWTVRGTHGDWGLYEKHFRSEPQIFDPITSISAVLRAATYEVQAPDTLNPSQKSAVQEFTEWCNGWISSIDGGFRHFVAESAETVQIYGPSTYEVLWGQDDEGKNHPVKFAYREPSTIEWWMLDDGHVGLDAVKFRSLDGSFILPNGDRIKGRRPTAKLLHTAIHQRGNNFEGIPPTRPAIFWRKLKKLLGQIAALAADKYGIPIAKAMGTKVDMAGEGTSPTGTASPNEHTELFHDLSRQRSGQAPVYKLKPGLDVEYEAPPGQMPTLLELMEYADQQISQPFKNEGSLLGQSSSVGSYALGKVQDDKFLRKAPQIAQVVLRPVDRLIRLCAQAYVEQEVGALPAYPTVELRLDVPGDSSQWLADVSQAMGGRPMTAWPEPLQKAALEKLGLPKDALDADEADPEVAGTGEAEPESSPTPDEVAPS